MEELRTGRKRRRRMKVFHFDVERLNGLIVQKNHHRLQIRNSNTHNKQRVEEEEDDGLQVMSEMSAGRNSLYTKAKV